MQAYDCDDCIERLKAELLVDISHEFRTPLTLVLGPLRVLEDGAFGGLRQAVADQVSVARSNAERVLDLVGQMLDAARLDAGRLELHAGRGDLSEVTRRVTECFRPQAERRGLALAFFAAAAVEAWFDPCSSTRCSPTLISNALKFTPASGNVQVSVRPCADRELVTVRVADGGPGIAPDQLPRVFERFFRGRNAEGQRITGTGLGLSLARDLVDLHGGSLTAESVEGFGSIFTVSLRLGRSHLAAEQVLEDSGTMTAAARPVSRLRIVEDSAGEAPFRRRPRWRSGRAPRIGRW